MKSTDVLPTPAPSNFLRNIIEADLARWSDAATDGAKIRTRFPPEPNGYLHIGHAKSICLNFGLARDYGGRCHLRFDDTNPEKEDQEYVDSIQDVVRWLGFDWHYGTENNLYFASDYFDAMYACAEHLVRTGKAYVDEQNAEQMRATRGTLTEPGTNSPWRDRPVEDNLRLLREMRDGKHAEGSLILRAKIDMAAPNLNLRDPALYRIRFAEHHRTGKTWCLYPMYTFAHPIEDALEQITHSICTLEFEDQRPFYNWLLDELVPILGQLRPQLKRLPSQYEFARLNLTYVITSKRKLAQLVNEGHVAGWDDPRLPTLVGLRRRGYTPEALQLFCDRIGVSKSDSWIDYSVLEQALRDDLDPKAARSVAVLDPLKLVLTNMPADWQETCSAPLHPHFPERGRREFPISRELWIEREDFAQTPPKGYFRLFPGNRVRLKYGYVVECTDCTLDDDGNVTEVQATLVPDTKSGTPGADAVKVKGTITWVSAAHAQAAQVRLYDRLFTEAQPDAGGKNFLEYLNPNSCKVTQAWLEPGTQVSPGTHYQFERFGYFVTDLSSSTEQPVFNRTATLKDSWNK